MMQRPVIIFLLIGAMSYAQHQLSYAQGPSSYPVVDPAAQKARDDDRRLILETELQAERQDLAKAQAALAAGPTQEREADVHRRSENIKALQRELDGAAGKPQAPRESVRVIAKAKRLPTSQPRDTNGPVAFWNPYNRAPDPEASAALSTSPRRESP